MKIQRIFNTIVFILTSLGDATACRRSDSDSNSAALPQEIVDDGTHQELLDQYNLHDVAGELRGAHR